MPAIGDSIRSNSHHHVRQKNRCHHLPREISAADTLHKQLSDLIETHSLGQAPPPERATPSGARSRGGFNLPILVGHSAQTPYQQATRIKCSGKWPAS